MYICYSYIGLDRLELHSLGIVKIAIPSVEAIGGDQSGTSLFEARARDTRWRSTVSLELVDLDHFLRKLRGSLPKIRPSDSLKPTLCGASLFWELTVWKLVSCEANSQFTVDHARP